MNKKEIYERLRKIAERKAMPKTEAEHNGITEGQWLKLEEKRLYSDPI